MSGGEYVESAVLRFSADKYQQQYKQSLRYRFKSISRAKYASPKLTTKPQNNGKIDPSIAYFHSYGFGLPALQQATVLAQLSGRPAGEELIRSGAVSRVDYSRICASHYGVEFSKIGPRPTRLTISSKNLTHKNIGPAKPRGDFSNVVSEYCGWLEKPKIYIACEPAAQKAINTIVKNPALDNSQIILTTTSALHEAQFKAQEDLHLDNAIHGLAKSQPDKSAHKVVSLWQGFVLAMIVSALVLLFLFSPGPALLGLHLLASVFYLAVTLMRAMMIIPGAKVLEEIEQPILLSNAADRELPIYSVLVALYREANQVDNLADALGKINWPADRLQILLVCEEGDEETIARCQLHCDDPRFQTVVCPRSEPQTKPKALNFALPLARGEFLVLYDAEDRPHKDQLREAYGKFGRDKNFACLQAPLLIHNENQSWFTRMFSIEYTTQFTAILPVLEKWHAPIPLGGTSNHFRTSILKKIGAWDPYNVTEDADLGMRLARHGYRCGTIKRPTFEESPPILSVWFKQRSRWIKGWIQTLLVHMRHPIALSRDLGWRKTMFFHLVVTAIVISVIIHPFFIISLVYSGFILANSSGFDPITASILGIDVFNLVGGYTTYFALAALTMNAKGKNWLKPHILYLPIYWLLISAAGLKALAQLIYAPFYWEKTPHGLSDTKTAE